MSKHAVADLGQRAQTLAPAVENGGAEADQQAASGSSSDGWQAVTSLPMAVIVASSCPRRQTLAFTPTPRPGPSAHFPRTVTSSAQREGVSAIPAGCRSSQTIKPRPEARVSSTVPFAHSSSGSPSARDPAALPPPRSAKRPPPPSFGSVSALGGAWESPANF